MAYLEASGVWAALAVFAALSVGAYGMVRWAAWLVREQRSRGFDFDGGAIIGMWLLWLAYSLSLFWLFLGAPDIG